MSLSGIEGGSRLRIGFNARLLQFPEIRGWNRYAVELLAELPACGVEPTLYSDRPIHPVHLDRLGSSVGPIRISGPMPYLTWEQGWLPLACRRDRVALLHSPFHFGLPWVSPCPMVLSLHDAIDWALGDGRQRDYRSRAHQWVARTRASRILTISQHARGDLSRFLGIDASRVVVIPLAADRRFSIEPTEAESAAARAWVGFDGPYLLYLGGWEKRKNLPFLIRAFARANQAGLQLVLAGGQDEQRETLGTFVEDLGVRDRVTMRGYVPDAIVPALYANALAFIYPSRYEGFGLQLCEAMASGCPTLAARSTSLPEVLGDGGLTFGLDDPGELAGLIRELAADRARLVRLSAKARERARVFSWRNTAEATAEVYRQVLSSHRLSKRGVFGSSG